MWCKGPPSCGGQTPCDALVQQALQTARHRGEGIAAERHGRLIFPDAPRPAASGMACAMGQVTMHIDPGASQTSLLSGPCRWRPVVLVPPTHEAGWADQNAAREHRPFVYGSVKPLPFADHLGRSNRIAREADTVELSVTGSLRPPLQQLDEERTEGPRRPLGREMTPGLGAGGNDCARHRPDCDAGHERPITERIALAAQPTGRGLRAVEAYQPLRQSVTGRLIDVMQ